MRGTILLAALGSVVFEMTAIKTIPLELTMELPFVNVHGG
jgi:hypothetical protein